MNALSSTAGSANLRHYSNTLRLTCGYSRLEPFDGADSSLKGVIKAVMFA